MNSDGKAIAEARLEEARAQIGIARGLLDQMPRGALVAVGYALCAALDNLDGIAHQLIADAAKDG